MKNVVFAFMTQIFGISVSYAVSYDCTKASTTVEKVVCGNPSLSALDDQLAQAYKNARSISSNPDQLKSDQIAWIKSHRLCEANVACIENSYKSRILALGGGSAPKAAEPPKVAAQASNPQSAPTSAQPNQPTQQMTSVQKYAACSGYHEFWAMLAMRSGRFGDEKFSLNVSESINKNFSQNKQFDETKSRTLQILTRAFDQRDANLMKSFAGFCVELNLPVGTNTK